MSSHLFYLGSKSYCTLCLAGTYSAVGHSTSCLACLAGRYSSSPGSTECAMCPPGSYSATGSATSISTCIVCPAGRYNSSASAVSISSCSVVPAGSYPSKATVYSTYDYQWTSVAASFDFRTMIISRTGNIYKSTDSGISWTVLYGAGNAAWTGVSCNSDCSKIAASSSQSTFGQTSIPGRIFKSNDSGNSWFIVSSTADWRGVVTNANFTKLLACQDIGIWRSNDSASTWTAISGAPSNVKDLAASEDFSKFAAVVSGSSGTIYQSIDAGSTWSAITSAGTRNWRGICVSADFTQMAAIEWGANIWFTSNSAIDWVAQTIRTVCTSLTADLDFSKIVCVGDNGIYHSVYNGAIGASTTFSSSSLVSQLALVGASNTNFCPVGTYSSASGLACKICPTGTYNDNTGATICISCLGGKYNALVGEASLTKCLTVPAMSYPSKSITYSSSNLSWVGVATSVDFRTVVATVESGGVYKSIDGGSSWNILASAGTLDWRGAVCNVDCSKVVICAYGGGVPSAGGGGIWKSANGGDSWTQIVSSTQNYVGITSNSDLTKFYVTVSGGKIWNSTDGADFSVISSSPTKNWRQIGSDANFTKFLAAAHTHGLYKSLDGSFTWTLIPHVPVSVPWYGVGVSADFTRMVASITDAHIYASYDAGASWRQLTYVGTKAWRLLAVSGCMSKLIAPSFGNQIYHSIYDGRMDATTRFTSAGPVTNLALGGAPGTTLCPAGTYSSAGSSYCKLCAGGTFRGSVGATCLNCEVGRYSSPGSSVCTLCSPGTYSTSIAATSISTCIACPWGRYNSSAGIGSISSCGVVPAGSYPTEAVTYSSSSLNWADIAVSVDYKFMFATMVSGYILKSVNQGATWTMLYPDEIQPLDWRGITCNSDCSKIAACVNGGRIWQSINGGESWLENSAMQNKGWHGLTSSANFTKLIATVQNTREIWRSTDSGITFSQLTTTWTSGQIGYIASNSDFNKFVTVIGDFLWKSLDDGVTWSQITTAGQKSWIGISVSANFDHMAATVLNGGIWISNDGSSTWKEITSVNKPWGGLTASSDLSMIVAVTNGQIYHSVYDGPINAATSFSVSGPVTQLSLVAASGIASCAAGTYSLAGNQGVYSSTPGNSPCLPCAAGTYSEVVGATFYTLCLNCIAGRYSSEGSSVCDLCAAGRYSNSTAAVSVSTCVGCPLGRYSGSLGSVSVAACSNCAAGTYSSVGHASCTNCTANLSSSSEAGTCCSLGKFTVTGTTLCVDCIKGKSANSAGLCEDCAAGSFKPASSGTCQNCPIGRYSSIGASSCQNCTAGSYSIAGSTTCSPCASGKNSIPATGVCCTPGQYTTEASTTCTPCGTGTYSASANLPCINCIKGMYGAATGISACTSCLAGEVGASAGLTACSPCGSGKYTLAGASVCTNCEPGKIGKSTGLSTCQNCDSGKFSQQAGLSTACTNCSIGMFANPGSSVCSGCLSGTYTDTTGSSVCTKVLSGTYAVDNITYSSPGVSLYGMAASADFSSFIVTKLATSVMIISKDAGVSWNDVTGAGSKAWQGVTSNAEFTLIAATTSNAGIFWSNDSALSWKSMGAESFEWTGITSSADFTKVAATAISQKIRLGTYSSASLSWTWVALNTPVSILTWSGVAGSSDLSRLIATSGTSIYKSNDGGASWADIPTVGTRTWFGVTCNNNMSFIAASVQSGGGVNGKIYVSKDAGTSWISLDSVGQKDWRGIVSSAKFEMLAAIGNSDTTSGFVYHSVYNGHIDNSTPWTNSGPVQQLSLWSGVGTAPCFAGTYSSFGNSSCFACPVGRYVSARGSSACALCNAGTFTPNTGGKSNSSCSVCQSGSYSGPGSSGCTKCPPGKTSPSSGGTTVSVCLDCAFGKYSILPGSLSCLDCPAGKMSLQGFSECTNCIGGTYSPNVGLSVCTNCAEGKFIALAGETSCSECAKGKSSGLGKSICDSCGLGTYSVGAGNGACSDCQPGSMNGVVGSTTCTLCLQNFYSDKTGSPSCAPCPSGEITPGEGAFDEATCFNPAVNFIQGFIISFVLIPFSIDYVVYGRFHRLAFLRKERVIQHLKERVRDLYAFTSYENARIESEKAVNHRLRRLKTWIFIIIGFAGWILFGAIGILWHFIDIYFKSLILYKNFGFDFAFVDRIVEALQFPFMIDFITPFLPFLEILAEFNINFGAFGVTCVGAAMPAQLMVNLVVLGLVIIVVDSDVQIFRMLTQGPLYGLIMQLYTKEPYALWSIRERGSKLTWTFMGVLGFISSLAANTLTYVFQSTDFFMSLLLFAMSTVQLKDFFDDSLVTSKSNACNDVDGFENYDTYVYYCAAYMLRLLIVPLTYELGEVIIPGTPLFLRNSTRETSERTDKESKFGITAALKYFSYISIDLWWLHFSGNHVTVIPKDIPYGTMGNAPSLLEVQEDIEKTRLGGKSLNRGGDYDYSTLEYFNVIRVPKRPIFRVLIDDENESISFCRCSTVTNGVRDWRVLHETVEDVPTKYVLIVISRKTCELVSTRTYKLSEGPQVAAQLAKDLQGVDKDNLVVLISGVDPKTNLFHGQLPAALRYCGASDLTFSSSDMRHVSSYILIGTPGCDSLSGVSGLGGHEILKRVDEQGTDICFYMPLPIDGVNDKRPFVIDETWNIASAYVTHAMQKRTPTENAKWADRHSTRNPSYWELCKLEHAAMMGVVSTGRAFLFCDSESISRAGAIFENFFSLISCIFVFLFVGHLFTAQGRTALICTLWKLLKFIQMALGVWTDDVVELYEIHKKVREHTCVFQNIFVRSRMQKANQVDEVQGVFDSQRSNEEEYLKTSADVATYCDSPLDMKSDYATALYAILAPRATLLQVSLIDI